ncbi:MAG: hypothetical protein QOJ35_1444 [Solirubrobacteraceae bacterium]|jgi:hypothetical protein|nr:hypothetical protein [Solirubrobacteraceae bacterium]
MATDTMNSSTVTVQDERPPSGVWDLALGQSPEQPRIVAMMPMGSVQRASIGAALVASALLLMTQLLAIWPAVVDATVIIRPGALPPTPHPTPLLFGIVHMTFHPQVVLIAMVLIIGALGALVNACRRFLYFATRDELTRRDEWSYLVRPVQGAALALIVYFTLRGGYLGQDQTAPVNPYGVAALSALVGLFTRHAVSKLTDVFDTLFGKPREETTPVQPVAGKLP